MQGSGAGQLNCLIFPVLQCFLSMLQVFDDPCPGQYKQLSVSFRCEPEANLPPLVE